MLEKNVANTFLYVCYNIFNIRASLSFCLHICRDSVNQHLR